MRQDEQHLTASDAEVALAAFLGVGAARGWEIVAAHVRATHAHLVVDGVSEPMRAIGDLKAYATRALRRHNGDPLRLYWARDGNARWLGTVEALRAATHYVVNRQGEAMAVFHRGVTVARGASPR